MVNLHKLYYKDYFSGAQFRVRQEHGKDKVVASDAKPIIENNKKLTSSRMIKIPGNAQMHPHCFSLKTLYPGLITGVGIEHEAGIEGELKLGIHLDYTTGAPVIYGSSVKGVLSSFIKDFLMSERGYNENDANYFEKDIFEGETYNAKTQKYEPKPISQRDVFFDAVIVSENRKGQILAIDALAPHGDNPLKNPIPISFLKIAPGVTLEFRFKLVDSQVAGKTLKATEKLSLFKEILATVGIGAKTNVGYGQLEKV